MSFSIFVSAFENEEAHRFPVQALREAFAGRVTAETELRGFGIWQLNFGEGPGYPEIHLRRPDVITGFSVNRPPDDLEFWKIIAGLLRDVPCLLHWPNKTPIGVMGSLGVVKHIPKQWIEKLGIPLVSTDPERIRQYVWENS